MTRTHGLLAGFLLIMLGMLGFAMLPGLGRLLVWCGAILVWLSLATAMQAMPWSASGKRSLQTLLGTAVVAVAMSATAFSLTGIMLASLAGALLGFFAPQWSRWLMSSASDRSR
jgi:hypothetical protein